MTYCTANILPKSLLEQTCNSPELAQRLRQRVAAMRRSRLTSTGLDFKALLAKICNSPELLQGLRQQVTVMRKRRFASMRLQTMAEQSLLIERKRKMEKMKKIRQQIVAQQLRQTKQKEESAAAALRVQAPKHRRCLLDG
jgi:hypothetical protein